jgi:hypothetical protein
MPFIIVTVLAVLATFFGLTFSRFLAGAPAAGSHDVPSLFREYSGWMGESTRAFFKPGLAVRALGLYKSWVGANYPGWRQWVFAVFVASFTFCAASGFFFAVFVPRGMFGIPLLCHVMAGGLFAVCLAAVLLLRAGAYRPDAADSGDGKRCPCPFLRNIPLKHLLTGLFWSFAAAGLVLIVTALFSMLPYLHFGTQFPLLEAHRYSALAALLAAMAFVDLGLLPRRS